MGKHVNNEEYQSWLEKNAEFLKRFIQDYVQVKLNKDSDYYGSEWYTASISVNVPYEIVAQGEANRLAEKILQDKK